MRNRPCGRDDYRFGEALTLVTRELQRVRTRRLTKSRLEQVKEQIKGQFLLGLESMASRMNCAGTTAAS